MEEAYNKMREILRIEKIEEAKEKQKLQKQALKEKIQIFLFTAVMGASVAGIAATNTYVESQNNDTIQEYSIDTEDNVRSR